jgi:hypothetical protein
MKQRLTLQERKVDEIKLDFRTESIYLQIMEQIKRQIASGELQPGDQLPTVRHWRLIYSELQHYRPSLPFTG